MRILKMMLGVSVIMMNSAQKNFHKLIQWTSLNAAINSGIYFVTAVIYVNMTAVTLNSIRLYENMKT